MTVELSLKDNVKVGTGDIKEISQETSLALRNFIFPCPSTYSLNISEPHTDDLRQLYMNIILTDDRDGIVYGGGANYLKQKNANNRTSAYMHNATVSV